MTFKAKRFTYGWHSALRRPVCYYHSKQSHQSCWGYLVWLDQPQLLQVPLVSIEILVDWNHWTENLKKMQQNCKPIRSKCFNEVLELSCQPMGLSLHLHSSFNAVLYTAPHDLLDSVGLIWSPNVTNCHMVGPVDSAGFRWSKCWLLSRERGPVESTGLCRTGLF